MLKLYGSKAYLQPQFIENLLLVACIVSFLLLIYKFGMVYTLFYKCFCICSNWTQFHTELIFLNGIFQKNDYPGNFIDKCFKTFLNNIHLIKENVPTVKKRQLLLVLTYLGTISLQTRTKLQQALKGVLNCCKLEIVLKCQTKLSNSFSYKDPIAKDFLSGIVYKLERRSNHQKTVVFAIIYSTIFFYPLVTTLVFYLMKTKSIY